MRRYTARPKRRGVSSCEDTPRPERRCGIFIRRYTAAQTKMCILKKCYNVVSLKRIVERIFGYHSNFGQGNGPKRGACRSLQQWTCPRWSQVTCGVDARTAPPFMGRQQNRSIDVDTGVCDPSSRRVAAGSNLVGTGVRLAPCSMRQKGVENDEQVQWPALSWVGPSP